MTDDDVDGRLRDWGVRSRAAVPAVPALSLIEPPARRRALAPLLAAAAVVATVAAVGVLVTSLGGNERVIPARTPAVVPWADLPAVPEAPPSPLPGPSPTYPDDARTDLTIDLEVPSSVEAGAVLHYVVRLTNPTSKPIRLEPCPSFVHFLASGKKTNQLNCAAADDVPANGTESFAMELPVPAGSEPDVEQLNWQFFKGEASHALVTIRNDSFVPPSPPPSPPPGCTTDATEPPPCGPGMVVGREYPLVAFPHCELQSLYADGRQWRPVDGPVGEGGNPPPGWGNPSDVGVVVLVGPDALVYTSSTGQRVELRPERPADPELPICS